MTKTSFSFVYFSFLIKLSISSYCGSYIPRDASSCAQYTTSDSICCFLRGNFEGNFHSMCFPFPRSIYYKMGRSVKINGYTFKLDCGSERGALCGDVVDPVSYKDCSVYSTSGNSCCFYTYDYKNPDENDTANPWLTETNCLWLGTSDIGMMQYKKLTVICYDKFMQFNVFLVVLMMVFCIF